MLTGGGAVREFDLNRPAGGRLHAYDTGPTGLAGELARGSVDTAVQRYRALKSSSPTRYNFDEGQLNRLGYTLLRTRRLAASGNGSTWRKPQEKQSMMSWPLACATRGPLCAPSRRNSEGDAA